MLNKLDQNIIEELSDKFFSNFNNQNFESLAFDKNLNHILQIFIKRHRTEKNDSIYKKIINKFDVYSKDKYGCYIIQAFLTNCKDEHYNEIYNETCKKFKELIKHESGTYLIVFFLKMKKIKTIIKFMVIYQEMFSIILVIKMQFTQLKKLMRKEQKNKENKLLEK